MAAINDWGTEPRSAIEDGGRDIEGVQSCRIDIVRRISSTLRPSCFTAAHIHTRHQPTHSFPPPCLPTFPTHTLTHSVRSAAILLARRLHNTGVLQEKEWHDLLSETLGDDDRSVVLTALDICEYHETWPTHRALVELHVGELIEARKRREPATLLHFEH